MELLLLRDYGLQKIKKGVNVMESDLYQIPYVEHEHRMYKAYIREKKLKVWLVITNCLWMAGAIITAIVR